MFRFIHSSDLHLGKRFGNFTGDLPGRLREARHAVLGRLAEQARAHGADTVLLAGDTFDTETPAPDVRRQAMMEMAQDPNIRWVILPGNHDSLQANELWQRMASDAPANVTLTTEAAPFEIAPNSFILPAPCTTRRPGRDLTDWMDSADLPAEALRIGLAHGAIQNFTEDSTTHDVIAPDRARRSNLDYLALGDWHGRMKVDERTYYSGTPETDRFKHNRPAEALLVTVSAHGALPEVSPIETGTFHWRAADLHLLSTQDPAAEFAALLPEAKDRRYSLLKVNALGHTRLPGHAELLRQADHVTHDFAWFELSHDGLAIDYDPEDLNEIDLTGALRVAANSLLGEVTNPDLSAVERSIASAALSRLYRHVQGAAK